MMYDQFNSHFFSFGLIFQSVCLLLKNKQDRMNTAEKYLKMESRQWKRPAIPGWCF